MRDEVLICFFYQGNCSFPILFLPFYLYFYDRTFCWWISMSYNACYEKWLVAIKSVCPQASQTTHGRRLVPHLLHSSETRQQNRESLRAHELWHLLTHNFTRAFWGYLSSDSHFWFFSEVTFHFHFLNSWPHGIELTFTIRILQTDPCLVSLKGIPRSFPGNCVLSCAEVWDDSDCIFKMQPASSLNDREAFWSGIYRDAQPWVFFFLAVISVETACPSSPSVLAAYSSLKSSLMKDGSPKVHKFDLHSHSKFEYPSEFLWPGNQVRDAVRLCPHGRCLWINLSLSLFSDQLETNYKKNALLFLFSLFYWSYQSIVTTF